MNRLIKLQLRNIFKSKLFYICLGLMLLMSPVLSFVNPFNSDTESLKVFPQLVDLLSTELGISTSIFVALFCCFDFNEGTTKNIIGRGYTKLELLFSKYIASITAVFTMYMINFVTIFILFIQNGFGFESSSLYILINYIIYIIVNVIFYSTISFLLEKNGSAIIGSMFIPSIVPLLLRLLDSKLNLSISKYWVDNVSFNYVSNPTLSNLLSPIIIYLIYIILFVFIGTQLIKRKEIK